MNWLAHLFLSEPDVGFRLGNLLADLVRRKDRDGMSPAFLRGCACHQTIDAFTDYHPVAGRSRARVGEEFGRFAGILIDVFYDHFLARNRDRYSPAPLDVFTAELYAGIRGHPIRLPDEARTAVDRMISGDLLGSYREIEGIEQTLRRVSMRLSERIGRPFALAPAVAVLEGHYRELGGDFAEFFPLLQSHVRGWLAAHPLPESGVP